MRSKGNAPTAAQKRFWDELAAMGCPLTHNPQCEIDHLFGASAKHNGEEIGNWAVFAHSADTHRLGKINRTNNESEFNLKYGSKMANEIQFGVEKELLLNGFMAYMRYYCKPLPFAPEILEAIMDYGY